MEFLILYIFGAIIISFKNLGKMPDGIESYKIILISLLYPLVGLIFVLNFFLNFVGLYLELRLNVLFDIKENEKVTDKNKQSSSDGSTKKRGLEDENGKK